MHPCFQTLLLGVLCTGDLAQSGYTQQSPAAPSREVSSVEAVVKSLQSCPAWTVPGSDPEVIVSHLNRLTRLSSPILRAGIEEFVARCTANKSYDIANMSKPFILNRLLFAVADKETSDVRYFGGWDRPPDDRARDELWPLRMAEDHKLHLTGKYFGYGGPEYQAVQEFDYFLRKYGRRAAIANGRPNPQRGANGKQPLSSDTNRAPAAAASRRSP
jgi:hypothetical protein